MEENDEVTKKSLQRTKRLPFCATEGEMLRPLGPRPSEGDIGPLQGRTGGLVQSMTIVNSSL